MKFFGYDPIEVPNPAGTRVPSRPCRLRFFGICPEADASIFTQAQSVSANIHVLVQRWKYNRSSFPIFISLTMVDTPTVCKSFLLVDTVGKGETQILVPVDETETDGHFVPLVGHVDGERVVLRTSSQLAVKDMLEGAARDLRVAVDSFIAMRLEVFAFTRSLVVNTRLAVLRGEILQTEGRSPLFHQLKAPRAVAKEPAKLPFGLSLGSVGQDHGSGSDSDIPADERSSNSSEADDDSDKEEPPLPPPVEPPPKVLRYGYGIFQYDVCKRASICVVCDRQIPKGSYRWWVRPRPGPQRHFQKYVHVWCPEAVRLISDWFEQSIDFLSGLGGDVPAELEHQRILRSLIARRSAMAASSSSGGMAGSSGGGPGPG